MKNRFSKPFVLASVAAIALAACGGGSDSADDGASSSAKTAAESTAESTAGTAGSATGDADAPDAPSGDAISIWVDAARVPAVEAFQEKYPDISLDVNNISNTGGSSGLKQQFALFNQAGEGWPDIIFFGSIDDIAWAAGGEIDFAKSLKGVISDDILSGYSESANAPCTQSSSDPVCLRNDQAQDVLWYNKKLFDEWGLKPPTTWAEYESVSLQIAEEHPGYYTGLLGDALTTNRYLWASGCPTNEVIEGNKIRIALDDPSCTRVVEMLDRLLAANVVSPGGAFDSDVAENVGPKLVMSPGATWWGAYLFRDTFGVPAGEMAVAEPPTWDGEEGTGNEGGGLWVMSKHIDDAKLDNATTVMEFMISDPAYQVELGPTFPAYGPLQQPWLDKQLTDGYYADADNLPEVFIKSGTIVRPYSLLQYNTGDAWAQTVVPKMLSDNSVSAGWDAFKNQLVNEAKTFGYEVVTE